MSDLRFQYAKVKGYSKKYKTKDGTVKETNSNTISLGSNTIFKDRDSVVVIYESDYKQLDDSSEKDDEINSLNFQLKEYSKKFQELEETYNSLFQEFQELKKERDSILERLNDANEVKENLHNSLHLAQEDLRKKDIIITKYEEMGLLKRIFKYNPKKDLESLEIPSKE